jgi:hypothetical protein
MVRTIRQTDPNDPCDYNPAEQTSYPSAWAALDCDGDGVTNGDEVDPDGDGYAGPNGTDPNESCSLTLSDVSIPATSQGDCDGDGVSNADEINSDGPNDPQTDPNHPCSFNAAEMTLPNTADTTGPVFKNCPVSGTVINDVNKCGAIVNWPSLVVEDLCDVTLVQTGGLPSGALFPVGTTTQTFVATDKAGNTSVCTFTVTVMDMQPPAAVCKNVTAVLSASGTVTVTSAQVDGGSSDNCGTVQLSPASQTYDCTQVGANDYTLTLTDSSGNTSVCVATVTVRDVTPPTFTCPAPITVSGCNTPVPSVTGSVVGNDACGIASVSQTPAAGLVFGQMSGSSTIITVTVTDVNGNSTTCSVPVTHTGCHCSGVRATARR